MDVSSGDYYRRLRVSRTASRQEIKTAFRRLARQYHPDLHPNEPDAAARFKALREAYEVLIDRVRRQRYDQRAGGPPDDYWPSEEEHSAQHNSTPDHSTPDHSTRERSAKDNSAPAQPTDFYIRGIRHAIAHRYAAALKDYTRAIELDSRFAEAYLRRAEVRYLRQDDSGVLADCQMAIALNETEAKAHYYQGLARYRLGYVQSAISAFTQAIHYDQEDARYHRWRGISHQDLRDLDDAATDFRRAAELYRSQGNLLDYQAVQASLRSLGAAGLAWPQKTIVRSWQRVTSPVFKHFPVFKRFPARNRHQSHQSQSAAQDFDAASSSTETSSQTRSRQNWAPPSPGRSDKPWDRPWNQPPENRNRGQRTPYNQPHLGQNGRNPNNRSLNNRNQRNRGGSFSGHSRQEHYWPQGISTRPAPRSSWLWRLGNGAKIIFRLMSNPGGELVPTYHELPIGKRGVIGYGLAVLANLCFVLGVSQYASNSSWLLASCLWASGAFTFVGMVLILSLVRLRLRNRDRWSADIYILGTVLLPFGLFTLASVVLSLAVSFLSTHVLSRYGLSELAAPFMLMGLGVGAIWAFSHAFIVIHSGLSRIHSFSYQVSAWLSPVILSFGFVSGITAWLWLAA